MHRGPHMPRVVDDEPPVRPHLDRRVRVVVRLEPCLEHSGDPVAGCVVVGADLDVALVIYPADICPRVRARVRDRTRVAEPRPGAIADGVDGGARGGCRDESTNDCDEEEPEPHAAPRVGREPGGYGTPRTLRIGWRSLPSRFCDMSLASAWATSSSGVRA